MYQYQSALVLGRTSGSQWKEEDISALSLNSVFLAYREVFLTLYVVETDEDIHVNLTAEQSQHGAYNGTVLQWLVSIGNTTLTTIDELPNASIRYARYADAYQQLYTTSLSKMGMNYPVGYPASELHDLKLRHTKSSVSSSVIEKFCLTTVNGIIHDNKTIEDNEADLWIIDGGKSLIKNSMSHVGILSFLDIGLINKYKISRNNIVPNSVDSTLADGVYFTIEGPLPDKPFFLVLGGYLVFPKTNVFWRLNDNVFGLRLQALPYIDRIYESSRLVDVSGLGVGAPDADGNVSSDSLWSDEVIKNYLTMSQSFLVTVDTHHLNTQKLAIRNSTVPGRFTTQNWPVDPLIVGYGRLAEYWVERKDREYQLSIKDPFAAQYIVRSTPQLQNQTVTTNPNVFKPYQHMDGFFLQLSGYRT